MFYPWRHYELRGPSREDFETCLIEAGATQAHAQQLSEFIALWSVSLFSFDEEGRVRGVGFPENKTPPGWCQNDVSLDGEPLYVPDTSTFEGRQIQQDMEDLVCVEIARELAAVRYLSSLGSKVMNVQTDPDGLFPDPSPLDAQIEMFLSKNPAKDPLYILTVPVIVHAGEGGDESAYDWYVPPGGKLLKTSQYWRLKENREGIPYEPTYIPPVSMEPTSRIPKQERLRRRQELGLRLVAPARG